MEYRHNFECDNEISFRHPNQLYYSGGLNKWFYVPAGNCYLPTKPKLFSTPRGFMLKEKMVFTLLSTGEESEMLATDADAILATYYFTHGEQKLKRLILIIEKPIIVSIKNVLTPSSWLPEIAKKMEKMGAAGVFTGPDIPFNILKKICSECSIPVFAASRPSIAELSSKINAGVFSVCVSGKDISKQTTNLLHDLFPNKPVIALCSRSEKQMQNSLESGSDALIFKPCVPFKLNPEDY